MFFFTSWRALSRTIGFPLIYLEEDMVTRVQSRNPDMGSWKAHVEGMGFPSLKAHTARSDRVRRGKVMSDAAKQTHPCLQSMHYFSLEHPLAPDVSLQRIVARSVEGKWDSLWGWEDKRCTAGKSLEELGHRSVGACKRHLLGSGRVRGGPEAALDSAPRTQMVVDSSRTDWMLDSQLGV